MMIERDAAKKKQQQNTTHCYTNYEHTKVQSTICNARVSFA